MHEYSIVQALLNQCEEIALENKAKEVLKIELKIGVMSGIEIELLIRAFDTFKEGTICNNAKISTTTQELKLKCLECLNEFEITPPYYYKCNKCNSLKVKVIDGEEMFLMRLELE